MVWIIAVFSVLLVAALARVFIVSARAIRRDLEQRFNQLEARLEEEANAVVKDLLKEQDRT